MNEDGGERPHEAAEDDGHPDDGSRRRPETDGPRDPPTDSRRSDGSQSGDSDDSITGSDPSEPGGAEREDRRPRVDASNADADPTTSDTSRGENTAAEHPPHLDDRPKPPSHDPDAVTIEHDGVVRWFLTTDDGTIVAIRDVASSVALVLVIGLILFGVSGVWPPMVAVESGSMEPNMERGDMIFVVENERFVGDGAVADTGIVPGDRGAESGHDKFGGDGDVIIFLPDGNPGETPVIHRAAYWVEEDENWVDERADADNLNGAGCEEVRSCPAPHDGFVTIGDANQGYDQWTSNVGADTTVVKSEWTAGKAMFRIPYLGYVRLGFESVFGAAGPWTPAGAVEASSAVATAPSGPTPLGPALIGAAGAVGVVRRLEAQASEA